MACSRATQEQLLRSKYLSMQSTGIPAGMMGVFLTRKPFACCVRVFLYPVFFRAFRAFRGLRFFYHVPA